MIKGLLGGGRGFLTGGASWLDGKKERRQWTLTGGVFLLDGKKKKKGNGGVGFGVLI